jgi:hypothetical protein
MTHSGSGKNHSNWGGFGWGPDADLLVLCRRCHEVEEARQDSSNFVNWLGQCQLVGRLVDRLLDHFPNSGILALLRRKAHREGEI